MRKPKFYYAALEFRSHYNMIDSSNFNHYDFNEFVESYSRYGFYRGNHYFISFERSSDLVIVKFKYTNFKRPYCSFCFEYYVPYVEVLKAYVDFKDFSATISTMMNGFFFQKGFESCSKFLR